MSPNPWNANNVRNSTPSGALNNNNANNSNGQVLDREKSQLSSRETESSALTQGAGFLI